MGALVPREHLRSADICLGSLRCRVELDEDRWARMLSEVYGTSLAEPSTREPDGWIQIVVARPAAHRAVQDRLVVTATPSGYRLETDPLICEVQCREQPWRALVSVRQPDMRGDHLAYHFWLLFNRLLLLFDRVVMHAAAVEFEGSVALFCGPKGAGKSTLSLFLLQLGGTLVAEDHVVVHRRAADLSVSGCSGRLRVTADTERRLFPGRLPGTSIDVSGVPKKEFPASQFFRARPYEDFQPARLFFNHVGARFRVQALSRRETLLRLMHGTRDLQRLNARADYQQFVDVLAALAHAVPAVDLELPGGFQGLDRVAALLRTASR